MHRSAIPLRRSVTHFVLLVATTMVPPAAADGLAYKLGLDMSGYRVAFQESQQAIVQLADGEERLLISVHLPLEDSEQAVWIFPVPAAPDSVRIEFIDRFPHFLGKDPRRQAALAIRKCCAVLRASQIYPLIELVPTLSRPGLDFAVETATEMWGLKSEALRVASTSELRDYVQSTGGSISDEQLAGFEPYANDRFALVVTRIASQKELLEAFPEYGKRRRPGERRPCLLVRFRTDAAFYPMRPTSGYGEAVLPVRLVVLGFVRPVCDPKMADLARVGHFRQAELDSETPDAVRAFLPAADIDYTSIYFRGPAAAFTDDLRFEAVQPPGMAYADAVNSIGARPALLLAALAGFLLLSYLAGGIAGAAAFRRWNPFAALGLWNLLTVVALMFQTRYVKWEKILTPAQLARTRWPRFNFLVVFSLVFVVLTLVVQAVLAYPL